eukprot:scaffold256508_cov39-Prasinocladus_malaysianus.AAC.1
MAVTSHGSMWGTRAALRASSAAFFQDSMSDNLLQPWGNFPEERQRRLGVGLNELGRALEAQTPQDSV